MAKMNDLPRPDQHQLEAADGWLGLGDWLEANEELEKISPQYRAHPQVLELRYKVYSASKRWDMALAVATALRELLPDNPWGHFDTAFSMHELGQTVGAYDTLI